MARVIADNVIISPRDGLHTTDTAAAAAHSRLSAHILHESGELEAQHAA
jgi:hypothetical protein